MPGGIKGRPPGARAGIEVRHITHPHHRPPGARKPGRRARQTRWRRARQTTAATHHSSPACSRARGTGQGQAQPGREPEAGYEAKRSVKHKTP